MLARECSFLLLHLTPSPPPPAAVELDPEDVVADDDAAELAVAAVDGATVDPGPTSFPHAEARMNIFHHSLQMSLIPSGFCVL